MTQLPGFNLYAIHKREISSALMTTGHRHLLWNPNDPSGWYVCSKPDTGLGVDLLNGPFTSEEIALSHARRMTDTSGT